MPVSHPGIEDTAFARAVDLLDAGSVNGLRAHLNIHPGVVHQRIAFNPEGYFANPSLLEFIAENPIRHGRLPANIVEIATVILDAGADRSSLDAALGLVCSGRVVRECGVQIPLIDLLCSRGANPTTAMPAALGHGEFQAVETLLRHGAKLDLPAAAATGRLQQARVLLASADPAGRHRALALAAQHGHLEIVRLLLDAGEDPDRYNPAGCHAHSTPLHQAALAGHGEVVRLLVERGARLDLEDTRFHGTPLGWAHHGGRVQIEEYLTNVSKQRTQLMPETPTKYSPVTVYLMVNDGNAALDFYRRAFAAEVIETYPYEGKLGHATLKINGGDVMLSDEFPEEMTGVRSPKSLGGTTCTVSLSVDDADAWFERAHTSGAAIIRPLKDEFYGRSGKVRDPFGHTWGIVGPVKTAKT